MTEWRGLYVRLIEQFPESGIPEFPIVKENLLTNYTKLAEDLATWFDTVAETLDDVIKSELFTDFLRTTPRDAALAATAEPPYVLCLFCF